MKNKNKCNVAALFALALTGALVLNTSVCAQPPPGSLWYNGDANFVNGLANERNTLVTQAAVYDDFNVTAPLGWNVTAVFSDNVLFGNPFVITGADWEIRIGISEGNAGTLVASGTTNAPVVTQTQQCSINFCASQVEVTGLNVFLPMLPSGQHYWLNVTPVGNGMARSFDMTTSGTHCVGTPCGNDQNAFFNSTFFGTNFTSTSNEGQPYDYSMGVIGAVVPEPPPWAMMAMGAVVLIGVRQLRRRNFAARAALLALALSAAFALNTTAIAQPPPGTLWYNGDFNNVNALANERNTIVTQAAVYDDFNVTAPLWDVTAVFSDNLASTVITAADWEIRTGVSEGNAGTLIASGTTNTPTVTPTGRSGFGFTEYMVEVTGLNVFLPMLPSGQHYWLNVTPVGNGTGRSFNTTTSGVNCVGTPCGNDQNAFFNSSYGDAFFVGQSADFSNGVIGTVVPEPITWAIMALGAVVLIGIQRLVWRKKA